MWKLRLREAKVLAQGHRAVYGKTQFTPLLSYSLSAWPGANDITSQSPHFLICKLGMIYLPGREVVNIEIFFLKKSLPALQCG